MKDQVTEFMGFYISKNDDNALRLQALLLGKSRSDLVRGILRDYILEKNLSVSGLIERYAKYIYNEWNLRLRDEISFEEHLRLMSGKLMSKHKVSSEILDRIIEACKEENL